MRVLTFFLAALVLFAGGSASAATPLERGFVGALQECETWVLEPASWVDGFEPFVAAVGLGETMGKVEQVDEVSLPPEALRRANHYWRINSTPSAGYVLVVSDQLPMCHITGGGDVDLQPIIEDVLASDPFATRWAKQGEERVGDIVTTTFKSREEPAFVMLVSRPHAPGQRRDRVQLIATAMFELRR